MGLFNKKPFHKQRNPSEAAPRNATLFCWYCDTRIGTILLNTLHLLFSVMITIFEHFQYRNFTEPPVLCILAIIFSGLGILGAKAFNLTAIFLATCGMICLFTLYLSELHVFGIIMVLLILFCQVVFMLEMRKGIMTKQNYEEHAYIQEEGREALDKAKSFGKDLKSGIARSVSSALSSDEEEGSGGSRSRESQEEC